MIYLFPALISVITAVIFSKDDQWQKNISNVNKCGEWRISLMISLTIIVSF